MTGIKPCPSTLAVSISVINTLLRQWSLKEEVEELLVLPPWHQNKVCWAYSITLCAVFGNLTGVGFAPSYSASKFAVRGLTQSAGRHSSVTKDRIWCYQFWIMQLKSSGSMVSLSMLMHPVCHSESVLPANIDSLWYIRSSQNPYTWASTKQNWSSHWIGYSAIVYFQFGRTRKTPPSRKTRISAGAHMFILL